MSPREPCLTPCTPHSQSDGVSHGRVSDVCSTKPFIHSAVTQKQPELAPPRRTLNKAPGFLSHHSLPAQKSGSSSQVPCSCCVSQCPFTYLTGTTHLHALGFPRGWQFVVSCLRLPPRAQSAPQKLNYLHQMYSSTMRRDNNRKPQ